MKNQMLRRVLGTMLAGVMMAGMLATGCGDKTEGSKANADSEAKVSVEENVDSSGEEESAEDWKKLNFTLGGEELVIPCSYEDFKKSGYSLSEETEKEVIRGNSYNKDMVATDKDGNEIIISVLNPSEEEEQEVQDGDVIEMKVVSWTDRDAYKAEKNLGFSLWDGFQFGDSVSEYEEITEEDGIEFGKYVGYNVQLEGTYGGVEGGYGDSAKFIFNQETGEFVEFEISRYTAIYN